MRLVPRYDSERLKSFQMGFSIAFIIIACTSLSVIVYDLIHTPQSLIIAGYATIPIIIISAAGMIVNTKPLAKKYKAKKKDKLRMRAERVGYQTMFFLFIVLGIGIMTADSFMTDFVKDIYEPISVNDEYSQYEFATAYGWAPAGAINVYVYNMDDEMILHKKYYPKEFSKFKLILPTDETGKFYVETWHSDYDKVHYDMYQVIKQ